MHLVSWVQICAGCLWYCFLLSCFGVEMLCCSPTRYPCLSCFHMIVDKFAIFAVDMCHQHHSTADWALLLSPSRELHRAQVAAQRLAASCLHTTLFRAACQVRNQRNLSGTLSCPHCEYVTGDLACDFHQYVQKHMTGALLLQMCKHRAPAFKVKYARNIIWVTLSLQAALLFCAVRCCQGI